MLRSFGKHHAVSTPLNAGRTIRITDAETSDQDASAAPEGQVRKPRKTSDKVLHGYPLVSDLRQGSRVPTQATIFPKSTYD